MQHIDNNKLKNIIFDLGGVIINLDVPKTIKAFENIGIKDIVNDTGHHYKNPIFYNFEIGKVSESEFIEEIANISLKNPSETQIKEAWNAMLLDIPRRRINYLKDLGKKYNIFLLSNTNIIHQKMYLKKINKDYGIFFNDLFKKAYYSHEIGIRKPNEEVFHFVLQDSNLKAEESLFVDDAPENIIGAKNTGMQTFHIENYNLSSLIKRI